jgi:hypothetical protein
VCTYVGPGTPWLPCCVGRRSGAVKSGGQSQSHGGFAAHHQRHRQQHTHGNNLNHRRVQWFRHSTGAPPAELPCPAQWCALLSPWKQPGLHGPLQGALLSDVCVQTLANPSIPWHSTGLHWGGSDCVHNHCPPCQRCWLLRTTPTSYRCARAAASEGPTSGVGADVYLKGNKATRGGAIDAVGSSLAITNGSYFQENTASGTSGGAIWMAYSILRMSESTCINNSAARCAPFHVPPAVCTACEGCKGLEDVLGQCCGLHPDSR